MASPKDNPNKPNSSSSDGSAGANQSGTTGGTESLRAHAAYGLATVPTIKTAAEQFLKCIRGPVITGHISKAETLGIQGPMLDGLKAAASKFATIEAQINTAIADWEKAVTFEAQFFQQHFDAADATAPHLQATSTVGSARQG